MRRGWYVQRRDKDDATRKILKITVDGNADVMSLYNYYGYHEYVVYIEHNTHHINHRKVKLAWHMTVLFFVY